MGASRIQQSRWGKVLNFFSFFFIFFWEELTNGWRLSAWTRSQARAFTGQHWVHWIVQSPWPLTTDHCSSDSFFFFFSFFLAPTTTTTTAPTVTCSSQPPPPFTIFALFQDLRLSKANNQHQIFDWILVVI